VAPIAPPAAPKGDAAPKEPLPPNPPPWKPPLNPPPPPEDLPRVKNVALGSPTRKDVMPYPPPIPFGAPRAPDKESRAGPLDQNTKLSLPPGQRMHASNVFKNANLPAGIAKQLQPNQHDGILAAKSSFWSRLEDNVRQRRFVRSALVTGRLGNAYADEWAEPGGLLIGFFASPQGPFLQPIYLTRSGEVVGGAYGNCPNEVLCFKAKAGYAVGGLHIHSGDVFEALSVTYMKVEETGLSRSNWYQSQWMGRDGGTAGFVGHQGHFIVGVQLRLRDTNMTTLGAIFLPPAKTKLN
jgi:hypothetical protein